MPQSFSQRQLMSSKISQYCIIRNGSVLLNGEEFFSNENAESAQVFFKSVLKQLNLSYPKFYKMDSLCKLAFLASEFILKDDKTRGINPTDRVAVVLSNSVSCLDTDIEYQKTISDRNNYYPSPALFVYTLPNIMIGEICIRNKYQGENIFFCSETFNADTIYSYANMLIQTNKADKIITGWIDFLSNSYEAALFLIEREENDNKIEFNIENLNKIYKGI